MADFDGGGALDLAVQEAAVDEIQHYGTPKEDEINVNDGELMDGGERRPVELEYVAPQPIADVQPDQVRQVIIQHPQPPVQRRREAVVIERPRLAVFVFLDELRAVLQGRNLDDQDLIGRAFFEKISFTRSWNRFIKLILAIWFIALFTAGSFHLPGLVYVIFMLVPVVCSWYPSNADLERW